MFMILYRFTNLYLYLAILKPIISFKKIQSFSYYSKLVTIQFSYGYSILFYSILLSPLYFWLSGSYPLLFWPLLVTFSYPVSLIAHYSTSLDDSQLTFHLIHFISLKCRRTLTSSVCGLTPSSNATTSTTMSVAQAP